MGKSFLQRTKEKIMVFDGAMGTMLMAAGLSSGESPVAWNLEKPQVVADVHKKYYEAGSDVVHTNTFVGNPIKLIDPELREKMEILNAEGARIAKGVCPAGKFVAGDMGPTGKLIEPIGDLPPDEAAASFYQQASALIKGGVDFISIETMYSLEETILAVQEAKRAGGDIVVIASITYNKTKKGFYTMMGEGVAACVSGLEEAGADVIGANCSLGSKDMIDLTKEIRAATERPILIQPNAGNPEFRDGLTTYTQTPAEFALDIKAIKEEGADMVGGCCGTTPEFIEEMNKALS
jgi:5-methyltetrahydrofolate--homocysteine methyltransferase